MQRSNLNTKMDRLAMCRICLAKDIRLHLIVKTHLQEMYKSLVSIPLETEDNRPLLVCYICCARLKNCYELRRNCIQSEELFTQMLSCQESKPMALQAIGNRKSLTIVHNIVHLSLEHVLHPYPENIGMQPIKLEDIKVEKNECEDIDEDASEGNTIYDHTQSTNLNYDVQIIVKEEQYEDPADDSCSRECKQAVQRNPEDANSSNLKEHEFPQNVFYEVEVVTADKTTAESTNVATFTLNNKNQEISTSVPHGERVQYTYDTNQQCYSSKCKLEKHIHSCSDVWEKYLSHDNKTSRHTYTGEKPHQCYVCKKSFSCFSHLTLHIRSHTGEKPYQCDTCKKSFSQKSDLVRHIRTHTGEKPYQCNVCQKYFSDSGSLSTHVRTHSTEKLFQCSLCKKKFSQGRHLTKHMSTHTGEKPYHCDICKKPFSHKTDLVRHIRTHTGEKPYHCNICKKTFSQSSDLVRHMRTHTGEKPYHCEICKRPFSKKSDLIRHTRTHTGEKPYQCNVCQKYFTDSSSLNKHVRTHSTEKPFQCSLCEKKFSQGRHLTKHMRTHTTGEKPYHCD